MFESYPWLSQPINFKSSVRLFCLLGLTYILLSGSFRLAYAQFNAPAKPAPEVLSAAVRGTTVRGELPHQYSKHYLGLEPTLRDGTIVLTLAYDPQTSLLLRDNINFLVLDEDGLRRFLAGTAPDELELASGSPLQFDDVGNKVRASFKTSARGPYTVVVYNNALVPATYTLTVDGGILVDDANQTENMQTASALQLRPIATGVTDAVVQLEVTPTPLPPGHIRARRVSSQLVGPYGRHYLDAEPYIRDSQVDLKLLYDPQDQEELAGAVNFWVLTEDGVRRMIQGDNPKQLNLATGAPLPFSTVPNELKANFKAAGKGPYSVVMYNSSPLSATYALSIEGGVLIDRYGQTNESRAALAERAAINSRADDRGSDSELNDDGPAEELIDDSNSSTDENVIVGELAAAYAHQYAGLVPSVRDGLVMIALDINPKNVPNLFEQVNFWVLTEDGLRRVVSGARPADVSIATGNYVLFGPQKGKLRTVFKASGRGRYTVILYNTSEVPVHYLLETAGGKWVGLPAQAIVPESLP